MPATIAPADDYLLPDAVYPLRKFLSIAGLSRTTLWRIENEEGIKLERIRARGKTFVEGSAGIAFLKARAANHATTCP